MDEKIKQAMIEGALWGVREIAAKRVRETTSYGGGDDEAVASTARQELIRLKSGAEMILKLIEELPE